MRAGKLRKRFEHQTFTSSQDTFGQVIEDWFTVGTYWGELAPASGSEGVNATQLRADVIHTITLRAGVGAVSPKDRFVLGSRLFNVVSVLHVEERHRTLTINAIEVV